VKTTILFGIAILCPLAALTAQDIKPFDAKPGLWETTVTLDITGMPPMPAMPQLTPDQLAKLPPEARQRLEAMMAGRGGGGSPRTITSKSCVSKESIEKGMAFANSNQANCTRKIVSSSSSKIEMHMECAMEKTDMKTVSDFTVERVDSEHVKAGGITKTTGGPNNRTMESKMNVTSKWLSADCGDLKPGEAK
jgi:hypothetical protein